MALLNRKNLRGKAAEEQARPAAEAAEEVVRVSAAVEILDLTSHWTKFVAFGGSSRVHGYADSGRIPRFAGMFLVRPTAIQGRADDREKNLASYVVAPTAKTASAPTQDPTIQRFANPREAAATARQLITIHGRRRIARPTTPCSTRTVKKVLWLVVEAITSERFGTVSLT